MIRRPLFYPTLAALPLLAALCLSSSAYGWEVPHVKYPGLKRFTFQEGPLTIAPGDNTFKWGPTLGRPRESGYITRFQYELVYADSGRQVPSSVLHLHHAGWQAGYQPAFPGGADRTVFQFPRGFGFPVRGNDAWALHRMIHNLTTRPARVFLRWHMDYIPERSPAYRSIKPVLLRWVNVVAIGYYTAFDALRGQGTKAKFTAPQQLSDQQVAKRGQPHRWFVDRPSTLVYATSHMHAGGLFSDLLVRRGNRVKRIFRSRMKYFDPGGRISWNMAQTATPADWRIKLKPGDVVYMSSTIDTSKASWRESMGVFPMLVYSGNDIGGVDPFHEGASWPQSGKVTHGPLPTERRSDGYPSSLPDPRSLPSGPKVSSPVAIQGFRYQLGDFSNPAAAARPPVIARGQRLTFVNLDYKAFREPVMHTITACRAPCNASSGVSYPLENQSTSADFDSGQLGLALQNLPSASGRTSWSTPANLPTGTYTFFCRLHPFMRGAFRVAGAPSSPSWSAGWSSLPLGGNIQ